MPTLEERLRKTIRIIPDFPKPGIQFKDITPILLDPVLVRDCVEALAEPFQNKQVTHVVGVESRGFLLGPMIAQKLQVPFVIVRKEGKLPYKTVSVSYQLEYGYATIEMHSDVLKAMDRVLIHDDLIALGGTAGAAAQLVQQLGGEVVGFAFIIELVHLKGREKLHEITSKNTIVHSLIQY